MEGIHRVAHDRDAVLARAEPQSEIGGLRLARAVFVDEQRGQWRGDGAMNALAGEVRARHKAIKPLAGGLRFLGVLVELGSSVPVLVSPYMSLGGARVS